MIFSNLNVKKFAVEVNTFIKDHGSNFSLDNLLLSVLYLPIVLQLARDGARNMETGTWNKKQLNQLSEQMIRSVQKVRRLVVALSPVTTTSSPFLARESLLIGDSAKQLDIKTPEQRAESRPKYPVVRSESSE